MKTVQFTVKEVQSVTKPPNLHLMIWASYYTLQRVHCTWDRPVQTASDHQVWHGVVAWWLRHGWTCALLGLTMLGHKYLVQQWTHDVTCQLSGPDIWRLWNNRHHPLHICHWHCVCRHWNRTGQWVCLVDLLQCCRTEQLETETKT